VAADGQDIPDPIRWLIEAGILPAPGQDGAPPDTSTWATADRDSPDSARGVAYVAGKLRGLAERLAAMPPDSGRNDALNYGAYKLGQHAAAGWIDKHEVWHTLLDAGLRSGMSRSEVLKTLHSAMPAGLANPEDPRLPPDRPGFIHSGDNPGDRTRRDGEGRSGQQPPGAAQDRPGDPNGDPEGSLEAPDAPGPPQPPAGFATLPDGFWYSRPELAHIRTAAWSRAQSPDVVLHGVLARIAALRDPNLRVESGIGQPASLNYYALIVGPSGDGKTSGLAVAEELVHCPNRIDDFEGQQPLGTGEGIAEAYMGMETATTLDNRGKEKQVKIRKKVRDRALFYVDEGERLLRLAERTGATSGETLRSAWAGVGIGARNANAETTRIIPAYSYSLGVIVGMQPNWAERVLVDQESGSPQRFVWATSDDPQMPTQRIEWPGDLPWNPDVLMKWVRMDMPEPLKAALYAERLARKRREIIIEPLDAHRPLTLVKLSGLLALLNGRVDVNDEDWSLAEMIWTTSAAVRDQVVTQAQTRIDREAADKQRRLIDLQEEIAGRKAAVPDKLTRIARNVAIKVHEHGIPFPRSEARHLVNSRDRRFFDAAAEIAISRGWLIFSEHGFLPGDSVPGNGGV